MTSDWVPGEKATPRTYGFLNLGRDKNRHVTTARIDRAILRKVRDHVPHINTVLFFCEIDEGDDNHEMALLREMFPKWQVLCGLPSNPVREPILLSPDLPEAHEHVTWLPGTAVKEWSPQRSLLRVRLGDETLFGIHPAAGAHGQGDRPDWAKGPLNASWDIADAVLREGVMDEHAKGQNVTWMADLNDYTYPHIGLDRTVVHRATDWGRAWEARGWQAHFTALPPVEIGLDSHDFLRMRGRYEKARG